MRTGTSFTLELPGGVAEVQKQLETTSSPVFFKPSASACEDVCCLQIQNEAPSFPRPVDVCIIFKH